jgi:hypothetical protein
MNTWPFPPFPMPAQPVKDTKPKRQYPDDMGEAPF